MAEAEFLTRSRYCDLSVSYKQLFYNDTPQLAFRTFKCMYSEDQV